MSAASAAVASTKVVNGGGGEDSGPWNTVGVPMGSPYNDPTIYFQYHHSNADMMSHVPADTFDNAAASWAIAAYGVAALEDLLPR